jgi:hypothetical protein
MRSRWRYRGGPEHEDDRVRPAVDLAAVQPAGMTPMAAAGNAAMTLLLRGGAAPPGVAAGAGNAAATHLVRGGPIQRQQLHAQGAGPLDEHLAAAIDAERGSGAPLPEPVRADMEQHLGADLTAVRVHTGATADALNQAVTAEAFTTGTDVFISGGRYDPTSSAGRELLAHELTHVVQQATGTASPDGQVSHPDDPAEHEAREVGRQVGHSGTAPPVQAGRGSAGGATVQRHASWEHALMGDSDPKQLGAAADRAADKTHVLAEEAERAAFFREDPYVDPRIRFPDIRWIELMGTAADGKPVWISYGELNALADYLPDASTIDHMPHAKLLPVLQRMRGIIEHDARTAIGEAVTGGYAQAADNHPHIKKLSTSGAEVKDLDDATEQLGSQSYSGLLSRNACHFAPYSWQRWQHFHAEAREHAKEHHRITMFPEMKASIDAFTEDHARQAILSNGYGDHFLQDSFAAGHLVNKTLVMQWFVESLRGEVDELPESLREAGYEQVHRPVGVTADVLTEIPGMTGISGRSLYQQGGRVPGTASSDRAGGTGRTDPQSAEERDSQGQRMSGAGVTASATRSQQQNFQTYHRFLNTTYINLAAAAAHDWLNHRGMLVGNGRGDTVAVGGDSTFLALSSKQGAELVGEAAQLSRRSVEELLVTGTTAITPEQIFALVPTKVVAWPTANGARTSGASPLSLENWQDDVLHQLCRDVIFPEFKREIASLAGAELQKKLIEGGASRDPER